MSEHTPGPWRVIDDVERDAENSWPVRRLVGTRQCMHAIDQPFIDEPIAIIESDNEADEKLLASAPRLKAERDELLALVQDIRTWLIAPDLAEVTIDDMRASCARAIANAERAEPAKRKRLPQTSIESQTYIDTGELPDAED